VEPKQNSQSFYRWVDGQGRVHVVSSLDAVPAADRGKATLVVMNGVESVSGHYPAASSDVWKPDWASFAAGFGVALLVALIFRKLPGSLRWLTKVGLVVGVGALLVGAYLGMLRRSTGMPGAGALSAPSALIEDAKAAVEQVNLRQKQQEEEIRKIQAAQAVGAPSALPLGQSR
jgi:hypothetical protein